MSDMLTKYSDAGYDVVSPKELFGHGSRLSDGAASYAGGYRAVEAEELFGCSSELADVAPYGDHLVSLVTEPLFQSLVVVTLIAYLYMMLRSWHFIDFIWGGVLSGSSERLMASMGGELPLQRFKLLAAIIGGVVLSLVGVRLSDSFITEDTPIYINGVEALVPLGALLFMVVVVAWFYSLHKVVGWVSHSDLASQLSAIGYIDFVRATVLLYPFAIVWLLSDKSGETWSTIALVVGVALLAILYIKDTFLFFIEKKIPILYWILYLCTAILLPLSFLARLLPERLG